MDLKVEPRTVQVQTANKLRDAILSGYFKPGQRLVESELCERMEVSRTSMREALRGLEAEKLITIIPNRGPSVAEITWEEAKAIYDVRAILEGEAAALFSQCATTEQRRVMTQALAAFAEAAEANDAMGRLTSTGRFYEVMLQGCGNSIISELLQGLVARINFLRARSMSNPGRDKYSSTEMRRILKAIEKKDADGARAAAVEHVRAACAAAEAVFEPRRAA
ncbi:MAG: GntR family transcriptional regulator [Betaproteobacteria bacterium]|nr:GntR family transcriptional regulator [Betaproteobacteria bacterium]